MKLLFAVLTNGAESWEPKIWPKMVSEVTIDAKFL
jgi:hypothetical protein